MPVSIVIGGQFGSEGKGKIALEIVRRSVGPVTVVRVGGPNSGHTAFDQAGKRWALRQMPAACVDRNVEVIFPPGSYIDPDVLLKEIFALDYPRDKILISPHANVITEQHKAWEADSTLVRSIGSTGSGVGAAVLASVARNSPNFPLKAVHAADHEILRSFVARSDTNLILNDRLSLGRRVVIEGSQGFGLSLLDGGFWPKATARTTTAAGALAEAGVSPRHVDDITMVIRTYPIRVSGESGPLRGEITWEEVSRRSGVNKDLREYTTVTGNLRRVGEFDGELVKQAIAANAPSRVVLNHLDYIGPLSTLKIADSRVRKFIAKVEIDIGVKVAWYGFSADTVTSAMEFNPS